MHLFDQYPQLSDTPHQSLCHLPSPIRSLIHTSESLTLDDRRQTRVFLKDDGLISSIYGGNKARKLEFILGDALSRERREVWTVGGVGSHHVLATALHSQHLGLNCRVFHVPQPLNSHVLKNFSALLTTEPELTLAQSSTQELPNPKDFKRQLTAWLERSDDPYYIPAGGSSLLGTLGYINAGLEIAQQIEEGDLPHIDAIYLAAGTCSTLAGLVLGLRLAGQSIEVIGVRVVPDYIANTYVIERLIQQGIKYLEEHHIHVELPNISTSFRLLTGHLGEGYGYTTSAGESAQAIARHDQCLLDPIYTAKAFGGLIEQERGQGRNVLFWKTLNTVDLSGLHALGDWRKALNKLPHDYQRLLAPEAQ